MHLFGCKFSLKTDSGDTVPDRKNFDSLLWAIVTVFQVQPQVPLKAPRSQRTVETPGSIPQGGTQGLPVGPEPFRALQTPVLADLDTGRLERGSVQRHGLHFVLGRPLLCGPHDLWELCALQPAGSHPGGRFPGRGEG